MTLDVDCAICPQPSQVSGSVVTVVERVEVGNLKEDPWPSTLWTGGSSTSSPPSPGWACSRPPGGSELLASTPWFQGSIEVRNPSIDPLNLIQIELMRRRRANPPPDDVHDPLRDLLRLTVQGIAAGMRTTG